MRRAVALLVLPLLLFASFGVPLGADCAGTSSRTTAQCPLCAHGHCTMVNGHMACMCGMAMGGGSHCACMTGRPCGDNVTGLFVLLNQPALLRPAAGVPRIARTGSVGVLAAAFLPVGPVSPPWEPPRS
jgi:hypothetical protein